MSLLTLILTDPVLSGFIRDTAVTIGVGVAATVYARVSGESMTDKRKARLMEVFDRGIALAMARGATTREDIALQAARYAESYAAGTIKALKARGPDLIEAAKARIAQTINMAGKQ